MTDSSRRRTSRTSQQAKSSAATDQIPIAEWDTSMWLAFNQLRDALSGVENMVGLTQDTDLLVSLSSAIKLSNEVILPHQIDLVNFVSEHFTSRTHYLPYIPKRGSEAVDSLKEARERCGAKGLTLPTYFWERLDKPYSRWWINGFEWIADYPIADTATQQLFYRLLLGCTIPTIKGKFAPIPPAYNLMLADQFIERLDQIQRRQRNEDLQDALMSIPIKKVQLREQMISELAWQRQHEAELAQIYASASQAAKLSSSQDELLPYGGQPNIIDATYVEGVARSVAQKEILKVTAIAYGIKLLRRLLNSRK